MSYQCCFCGCAISEPNETPIKISIETDDHEKQTLWCHPHCLRGVLHHSVPTVGDQLVQIYMPLDDEGVDCYRPVNAVALESNKYLIARANDVPNGEHWRYSPGTIVLVKHHTFSGGSAGLVAVEECEAKKE